MTPLVEATRLIGSIVLLVLCEIQWVVEFHFAAEEVNHVDDVLGIAVASDTSFGKLDFAIDAF